MADSVLPWRKQIERACIGQRPRYGFCARFSLEVRKLFPDTFRKKLQMKNSKERPMHQNRIKRATTIKPRNLSRGLICCLLWVAGQGTTAFGQQFSAWSAPVNLGPTINTTALEGCPAISRDGLSLFYASNRPGGQDGLDLYVTHRESLIDPWGPAANLGTTINGTSNDFCPTLSTDGHLLFFASNRPGGCGGIDIYVSRRQDKSQDFGDRGWGPPQNLGCTVNSDKDDFGPNYFEVDSGGILYFNSNRVTGAGGQDIYAATRDLTTRSGCPRLDCQHPFSS
jgi:hypothetical protein